MNAYLKNYRIARRGNGCGMKSHTVTTYSLGELNAEAVERAFRDYRDAAVNWDVPWQAEIMESLKAVSRCLGFRVKDWSIGPYSQSDLTATTGDDALDDLAGGRALAYARRKLRAAGFKLQSGPASGVRFDGWCPLTGYCGDDDAAEYVWKSLLSGNRLRESVEGLAAWASQAMESECENLQSREEFELWAEGVEFWEDGKMYRG